MSSFPKKRAHAHFSRAALKSFCAALTLLGTTACSSEDASEDDAAQVEQSLEIFSWLTESGEREALEALFDELHERYPDLLITNAAATEPTSARERLDERLRSGEPPDSFQVISGVDLFTWVDDGKMEPITDLADTEGWQEVFPPAVLDVVSRGGEVYGVPANIERDNNLYYNLSVMTEHAVDPPGTLEDFYAACETLQGAGVVPLALPAAGWVLALVAFETLMPAVTGGEFYLDFFRGDADPGAPEVRALFEEFAKVVGCSDVAGASGSWGENADRLVAGDAAMFVMGDWAKGYFEGNKNAAGETRDPWVAGTDFGVVPGLGSAGYFTFNSLVFGLPRGAQHPNAARAFLEVVGSSEGQTGFNKEKGSVPARTDVSLSAFDEMVRQASEDFQVAADGDARLLPGYASLTRFDFQVEINPSLLVFAAGGERARQLDPDNVSEAEAAVAPFDLEYILGKIEANYGLLSR